MRKLIATADAKSITVVAVISRLDYCNSLLLNAPDANNRKLQRDKKSFARLVVNSNSRLSITPIRIHLHWLPVAARSRCNISPLTLTKLATNRQA
jgi:hypothetical protein